MPSFVAVVCCVVVAFFLCGITGRDKGSVALEGGERVKRKRL
jgi:hypothetical protein